jgi:capsular exopolysaccharide synthesis family protein
VVLVDGDLRRGEVHTAFDAPRGPGLTEILRGTVSFAQACRSVEIEGTELHYVTTGAAVPSPTSLLDSEALRDLLAKLRQRYDIIVIDSPPTNIVTDAAVLGALADGVILVARVGVTEAGALGTAIHQLHHVRATMLGVVLNDINFKRDASYDASYRYYNYGQYLSSTSS